MRIGKKPRAMPYLTLLLLTGGLALWAGIMAAVTYHQAVVIRNLAVNNAREAIDIISHNSYEFLGRIADSDWDEETKQGYYNHELYSNLHYAIGFDNFRTSFVPEAEREDMAWPEPIEGESFIAVAGPDGGLIAAQQSCILLPYEDEEGNSIGRTVILMPEDFPLPNLPKNTRQMYSDFLSNGRYELTGWFEGGYFIPIKILAYGDLGISPGQEVLYESGREVPADAELVTLNTGRTLQTYYYFGSSPVSYGGRRYADLEELAAEFARQCAAESEERMLAHYGLRTLVYLDRSWVPSLTEGEYNTMIYVARCSPLLTAMKGLLRTYVISLLALLILVFSLRRLIWNEVLWPVEHVNEYAAEELKPLPDNPNLVYRFRELDELSAHYDRAAHRVRSLIGEQARLNRALEYAKTAEENRRQMTSAIAHELKTPLAVIHSYAEGLQEHIAEGKREKYIDVILSETERLDDMVLELLDLSRLEAGKVKLAREDFSLAALAHSVFARLEMAAQAKDLTISFDFPGNCTVTADEGRIRQVIENFATNAVKYTPAGGHIRVRVAPVRAGITFSVENDSPPLSKEALEKVWDTFYRADEARSGGGTGLGLAIAKNIVELHGGSCRAQNTSTGVEFSFTI